MSLLQLLGPSALLAFCVLAVCMWQAAYGPSKEHPRISLRGAFALMLIVALIGSLLGVQVDPAARAVLMLDLVWPGYLLWTVLIPAAVGAVPFSLGRSFSRRWRWGFGAGAIAAATFLGSAYWYYVVGKRHDGGIGEMVVFFSTLLRTVAVGVIIGAVAALMARLIQPRTRAVQLPAVRPDAAKARWRFIVFLGIAIIGLPAWRVVREPAIRGERDSAYVSEVCERWRPLGWVCYGESKSVIFRASADAKVDAATIRRLRNEAVTIRVVDFWVNHLSDEALAELSAVESIEVVSMRNVITSREGIMSLARLPRLRTLAIGGQSSWIPVNPSMKDLKAIEDLKALRTSRPDVSITVDGKSLFAPP
jgi:hypothetical protein